MLFLVSRIEIFLLPRCLQVQHNIIIVMKNNTYFNNYSYCIQHKCIFPNLQFTFMDATTMRSLCCYACITNYNTYYHVQYAPLNDDYFDHSTYQHCIMMWQMSLGQPGGGGRRKPLSTFLMTSCLEYPSNGLCPRLHISYTTQPKLHTSLKLEYFLQ